MTKALIALAVAGLLQSPAQPGGVTVSIAGGSAHLRFAELSGIDLDLKPFTAAAIARDARVFFVSAQASIVYLVIHVAGPTRAAGGSGYCGGGDEGNLVWMKVSHAQVLDVRSVLYTSCTFSIESEPAPSPTKDGLEVEYESFSERRKFVLTYDQRAPDKGFVVVSSALEP